MKWVYYEGNDELRGWNPDSTGSVIAVIVEGDIEIHIDEKGLIQEVIVANASKKLSMEEIESIAEKASKEIEIKKLKTVPL